MIHWRKGTAQQAGVITGEGEKSHIKSSPATITFEQQPSVFRGSYLNVRNFDTSEFVQRVKKTPREKKNPDRFTPVCHAPATTRIEVHMSYLSSFDRESEQDW